MQEQDEFLSETSQAETDSDQPLALSLAAPWWTWILVVACFGVGFMLAALGIVGLLGDMNLVMWALMPFWFAMAATPFVGAVYLVWRGSRRILLDHTGIHSGSILGMRRSVPWLHIVDYSMDGGVFPNPPSDITLHVIEGRPLKLTFGWAAEGQLAYVLRRYLPMSVPIDFEAPRNSPLLQPTSYWRVRLTRCGYFLAALYGGGLLLLLGLAGTLLSGRDFVNYWRIKADPVVVQGTIDKVDFTEDDDKNDYVSARYPLPDGPEAMLHHRRVPQRFAKAAKIGDAVAIEFLRSEPKLARLRDWDLDGREWFGLMFAVPFIWIGGAVLYLGAVKAMRPPRERFAWISRPVEDRPGSFALFVNDSAIGSVVDAFPTQHARGIVVFLNLKSRSSKDETTIAQWSEKLEKAGIGNALIADRWIVLGPESRQTLFKRIRGSEGMIGDYVIVPDEWDLERVKRLVLKEGETDVYEILWSLLDSHVSPLSEDELADAFEAWVRLHLRRLYEGVPAPEPQPIRFSQELGIGLKGKPVEMLAERTRKGFRLWMQRVDSHRGDCLIFDGTQVQVLREQRMPRGFKTTSLLVKFSMLLLLPLLPLILLTWIVRCPFTWWERRQQRRKIEQAAAELAATQ